MKITGKVKEGKGKAQKFLSMKPYKQKIKDITGFSPFPGTLNLKVEPDKIRELKDKREEKIIEGFEYQGKDYGGLKLYKVEIEGLGVTLLDIDRADHGEKIAEIIAEEKLRETLDLENGEKVELHG